MRYPAALLTLALALATGAVPAPQAAAPPRIVAIGDVHGAAESFAAILARAGVIDAARKWTGGKTILVQTGDVTDRGAGVRESLDLLMSLEKQAAAAGGKVHVLVGNHEVMNMVGELRDVSPESIASLGGAAAYREAFARDGRYGKWLRAKPILAKIEDTVFMHAGINLEFSAESLDALTRRARREIDEWDAGVRWLLDKKLIDAAAGPAQAAAAARQEIEQMNALAAQAPEKLPADAARIAARLLPVANLHASSLFHADGPLWFRGYSTWTDADGAARMTALLEHYRVKRFVTGHTVQPDGRIKQRFGGSLFLIDTGMLGGKYWPNGRPSALELAAGATPLYLD